ncbi:hypothetical protein NIES4071_17260 [Calothrix sp. NIES-4071]|nr:hypothetical protein NIES4071_17260 [Calothrix sp. NIES-4071]BAZ56059.1 hypothetical protein NIES4105_17210 [Calothrix sp. NIES-4105]
MTQYDYFLNPHPREAHYIARSSIITALTQLAPKTNGRVLDIGSGESRGYEGLFKPYIDEYLCLDRQQKDTIDICADCCSLPVEDNSFDVVISTQVLEHLESPTLMLKESYRVLKPKGLLIMTVPMVWGLHEEPYDFFRYTEYGINHLLETSGYTDISIKPLEGLFASVFQLVIDEYYQAWLSWNGNIYNFIIPYLNKLAIFLDKTFPTRRLCLTYLATAVKI